MFMRWLGNTGNIFLQLVSQLLESVVARMTTCMTKLSRSKWSFANLRYPGRMIGQLCVDKDGGCSILPLSEESTCHSLFGLEKVCFALCFLKGHRSCLKEYDSSRGYRANFWLSESFWSTSTASSSSSPSARFFLICYEAALRWQPITSVEFKLVLGQVEASVVIRATKLKFVAESRTQVYFSQHVASTCNTILFNFMI